LSSFGATFRVDDEQILAARAQSLALWGNLEEPQVYGNLRVRQLSAFGDQATQIEPAWAVLGAVLYRLGMILAGGGVGRCFRVRLVRRRRIRLLHCIWVATWPSFRGRVRTRQ